MNWPMLGRIATIVCTVLLYVWIAREAVRYEIEVEDNGEVWI